MQKHDKNMGHTSPVAQRVDRMDKEIEARRRVMLMRNENPLGDSNRFPTLLDGSRMLDIGRYPDMGYSELIRALSRHLEVDSECIAVGAGSSDILWSIGRAFLVAGRCAIVSTITFELYEQIAESMGVPLHKVDSILYSHDILGLAAAAERKGPGVVFIDNPCNPAGSYLRGRQVIDLIELISAKSLIVIDEAYFEYVDVEGYSTSIGLVKKYPNVIVTRTFSKAFGLAGLRLGYCVAEPAIIEMINEVRPPFLISSIASELGVAALHDHAFVKQSRQLASEERKRFLNALRPTNLIAVDPVANFIFLRVGCDKTRFVDVLRSQNISIREFGNDPEHIRITIGLPEENMFVINILMSCKQHDFSI